MIFFLAIGAIIKVRNAAVRIATESGMLAQGQALAEMKMTDIQIKYQDIIDKSGIKSAFTEEEGDFEPPYETFHWKAKFAENPLVMDEKQLLAFMKAFGVDEEDSQNTLNQNKLLLANLNKALAENMGELSLNVTWKFKKTPENLLLVTHLIPKNPKITFTQNADLSQDYSP